MVAFATLCFAVALLGVGALFALKHREVQAGRVLMPVSLRERGDERALAFKDFLGSIRAEAHTWPSQALLIARVLAHRAMLALAAAANATERNAHALADRLSHRHHVAPRESTNEFLRQVGDFKHAETASED